MALSRDKALDHLDKLLEILSAIAGVVGDRLLPADIVITALRAALASLEDDKIEHVNPDEIRAMIKTLRDQVALNDANADARLRDKFKADAEGTPPEGVISGEFDTSDTEEK